MFEIVYTAYVIFLFLSHTHTPQVHPGWRVGTRIAFKGAGDEGVNNVPGDVAFILKERPHPRFRREKNDLVYPVSLSLAKVGTVCVRVRVNVVVVVLHAV